MSGYPEAKQGEGPVCLWVWGRQVPLPDSTTYQGATQGQQAGTEPGDTWQRAPVLPGDLIQVPWASLPPGKPYLMGWLPTQISPNGAGIT